MQTVYVILEGNALDGVYAQSIHTVYGVKDAAVAHCAILNRHIEDGGAAYRNVAFKLKGRWDTLDFEVEEHTVL